MWPVSNIEMKVRYVSGCCITYTFSMRVLSEQNLETQIFPFFWIKGSLKMVTGYTVSWYNQGTNILEQLNTLASQSF